MGQLNPLITKIDHQYVLAYGSQKLSTVDLIDMSSTIYLMKEALTVLDKKGVEFRHLLSRVQAATPSEEGTLRRAIDVAVEQYEINWEEANDLHRLLTAQLRGDQETLGSLLLKDGPSLLTAGELGLEGAKHRYRMDNECAKACEELRWDSRKQCAKCMQHLPESCMKKCPARDAAEAQEEQSGQVLEMVA